jgi:hypothetical protein
LVPQLHGASGSGHVRPELLVAESAQHFRRVPAPRAGTTSS